MSLLEALHKSRGADPMASYLICDLDENVGAPSYFGYCGFHGGWFIKRYDDTTGAMRYAGGADGYATAWTGRAGLTYALPDGG